MARVGDIFEAQITGEWGNECTENETGTKVLRTTNFTPDGIINFDNIVLRSITESKVEKKRLHYGDIILEKSGGTEKIPVGRVVFCDKSIEDDTYLCNNFTQAMRVNQEVGCPRYVFYFMWYLHYSGKTDLLQNKTTGIRNLQVKSYLNEEIPLPSLEEQRHISATLDKVSDLIAKRRAQLDKLHLLVKARFVEMTEDSETVLTRMGDVATYINGYAFKPTNWSENGLPIIRIQNLNNANAVYNYFDGVLPEKYLVRKGDVLVSWATHLEAYIWKGHDAWLNQHIFKVVFDKIPINDVYFVYSTEEALRQAFKNAHGSKPTMEHIKRSDFEDAVIQLPNVEVQNKFAKFAAQVDKSKLTIQQSLDKLEILKKALMQQYFGDL